MTRRRILSGALAALLAGCIFEGERHVEIPLFVSGYARTVPGYEANGAPGAPLGFGIVDGDSGVFLVDRTHFPPPSTQGSWAIMSYPSPYSLAVTAAYTGVFRDLAQPDPQTNVKAKGRTFAGFPCRLSRPRGYQRVNGTGDSIALVFSELRLERHGDSVRLFMGIDTAASKAADARAVFGDSAWVYGTATATCPEI
jgi:hypothetical protein